MDVVKKLSNWYGTLRVVKILNTLKVQHNLNLWNDKHMELTIITCVATGFSDEDIIRYILKDFTIPTKDAGAT